MNNDWLSKTIIVFFVLVVGIPLSWDFVISTLDKKVDQESSQGLKLVENLQGQWEIDLPETMQQAAAEAAAEADSKLTTYRHPEINVNENRIRYRRVSEYLLFDLHEHDGWICGKAWHHESIDDPGDMSKCMVRLRRTGERLVLRVQMRDGSVPLDDPDLEKILQLGVKFTGSQADCEFDSPRRDDWGDWYLFVFKRKEK